MLDIVAELACMFWRSWMQSMILVQLINVKC